jgi:hypothetical protein
MRVVAILGLVVLADVRRRAALTALVAFILACGVGRIWLALAIAHLDTSPRRRPRRSRPWASSGSCRLARRPGPARCWRSAAARAPSPPGWR